MARDIADTNEDRILKAYSEDDARWDNVTLGTAPAPMLSLPMKLKGVSAGDTVRIEVEAKVSSLHEDEFGKCTTLTVKSFKRK